MPDPKVGSVWSGEPPSDETVACVPDMPFFSFAVELKAMRLLGYVQVEVRNEACSRGETGFTAH